ncbi:MAG: hypothetical protein HKM86_07675 [Deltaproteobacteria bacterium]|nr:hypothetical protein [Deltaproteobacteria bacterium]
MRKFLWAILVLSCFCAWPASGEEPAPKVGDPVAGKSLFSGSIRFHNGGAACLACHAIAGLPGGGRTLGPDLTQVYNDYGEEEITSALGELPFPSMKPIYDTRPLTAVEQSDVKSYLQVAAAGEPSGEKGWFLLIGLGGGAFMIGLAHLVWRNRLREVRRPLIDRAQGPGGGDA